MTKYCKAPNCNDSTGGFSTLCDPHKQTQRRHGEADQTGVTVHQLRPYVARVMARQAKNSSNESWALLRHRWAAVTDRAQQAIAKAKSGVAYVRHDLHAAQQLCQLGETVPANDVVCTALGMYLYREDQPYRFKSDRAFNFQLWRRMRGLSPSNAGTYWDAKTKRNRKVYKDLPPRVVEALAEALIDAFGVAGLMLARKEEAERQQADETAKRLTSALEALE